MNHWELVLTEVFLVPPALLATAGEAMPESVEDLARISGLDAAEVRRRLDTIGALQSPPVEVHPQELAALRARCAADGQEFILLDVRSRAARANAPSARMAPLLAGSISVHDISRDTGFPDWLRAVATSCVVTTGRDAAQAWSAAMYLRSHGLPGARALNPDSDFTN